MNSWFSLLFFVTLLVTGAEAFSATLQALTGDNSQMSTELHVRDGEENAPLIGAQVLVYNNAGKVVARRISDPQGRVVIPQNANQEEAFLIVGVSYVGYEAHRDTLRAGKKHTIRLQPANYWLDDVVVTAQMDARNAREAMHRVRVIDDKQIEQLAARDLEDVLQQQTGMRIQQDAILGSSVSIQGLSGEHVNIMVDGVPLVGRQNGSVDLQQLPLAEVERIEIIEGPLSVQYGSDAMAGTINIITKKPKDPKLGLHATTYGENTGVFQQDFSISGGKGRHRVRLGGTFRKFDGWRPDDDFVPELAPQLADERRTHQWNPRTQYQVRGRYRWAGDRWQFGYRFQGLDETILNRGRPLTPFGESAFDDVFATQRLQNDLTAEGRIGEHWRFEGLFSRQDYRRRKNTYRKDLTTLDEQLTADASQHDTTSMQQWMARGTFSHYPENPDWNVQMGYDARLESLAGGRVAEDAPDLQSLGLFGAAEWQASPQLKLRPGFRWMAHSAYQAPITPSLKARFAWSDYQLRAGYAHGFRAPGLKELHFYFVDVNHFIVGNPSLEAENSRHYNLSLRRQSGWDQEDGGWEMSLNAFHNRVEDQISLAMVDAEEQRFSYVNTGRFRSQGLEWEGRLRWRRWEGSAGASYTGRYNQLAEEAGFDQLYRYTPQFRVSGSWSAPSGWQFSSFYTYQGAMDGYALNQENDLVKIRRIADYGLLDAQVQKRFAESGWSVSLGCKNLLDVTQVAAAGGGGGAHSGGANSAIIGMGRTLYLRTQWQWTQK